MYVAKEQWDADLRQGDVVGPIHFPLMSTTTSGTTTMTSLSVAAEQQAQNRILVDTKPTLVAVLSHCCEFNDAKRKKLLVAPLHPAPPDKLDSLRENNDVLGRVKAQVEAGEQPNVGWVNAFIYENVAGHMERPYALDFSSLVNLPMAWNVDFLTDRRAQLDEATREFLRLKLAFYFSRSQAPVSAAVAAATPTA